MVAITNIHTRPVSKMVGCPGKVVWDVKTIFGSLIIGIGEDGQ